MSKGREYAVAADKCYDALTALVGIKENLQLAEDNFYHAARIIVDSLLRLAGELEEKVEDGAE